MIYLFVETQKISSNFLCHVSTATVNENDVLARAFEKGEFCTVPHVTATIAPAMDINVIPFKKALNTK